MSGQESPTVPGWGRVYPHDWLLAVVVGMLLAIALLPIVTGFWEMWKWWGMLND